MVHKNVFLSTPITTLSNHVTYTDLSIYRNRSAVEDAKDQQNKNMAAVTTSNFANLFLDALKLKETEPIFQKIMRPIIKPMFQEYTRNNDKQLKALKEHITIQDRQIRNLEYQLDQHDQDSRANKAVITGIQAEREEEANINNLVDFFDVMDIHLDKRDIMDAHSISQNGKTMLVTFTSPVTKRTIFKEKKKLQTNAKIVFINDSLTKRRASLFKKARDLVKTKSIAAAWSGNGNIYVKEKEEDQPKKIICEQELERFLKMKITASTQDVERRLGLKKMDQTPKKTNPM